ncbi:MAG: lipoyl synthase [Chloroflexi bacterium]|nr:lipoyl synthase [Chloroflexota bacterium]
MSGKHPAWLRQKGLEPAVLDRMKGLLDGLSLHTVCESAACPNQGRCFAEGTATFLILGDTCTRGCTFCAIDKGRPPPPDPAEPERVARAVHQLSLKHAVVTSVTRDDLPDGGARHFAETVIAIRRLNPTTSIEVLIPDFRGSIEALQTVVASAPRVINHNIETVPRLYGEVRPAADYGSSLNLLRMVKSLDAAIVTKSGLMLGLGEREEEVMAALQDLRAVHCDCLTLGQYLPPSTQHHPLVRYVTPEGFEEYGRLARQLGFIAVRSGPLVRSSYDALDMCAGLA